MDIKTLVAYEQTFSLDIKNPKTDKPVGITMEIRSAESPESKAVLRLHIDVAAELRQKGKIIRVETQERQELEKAASYIASWDWGSNTYDGATPELTMENAVAILEREGWIYAQVRQAASDIGNFMLPSGKGSAKR